MSYQGLKTITPQTIVPEIHSAESSPGCPCSHGSFYPSQSVFSLPSQLQKGEKHKRREREKAFSNLWNIPGSVFSLIQRCEQEIAQGNSVGLNIRTRLYDNVLWLFSNQVPFQSVCIVPIIAAFGAALNSSIDTKFSSNHTYIMQSGNTFQNEIISKF